MNDLLPLLALLLTALLFGGMAVFSFLLAPLIFANLAADTAGRLVRAVFPWYFLAIIIVSAVAGVALLGPHPGLAAVLLAVAAAGIISRQVLMPAINRFRDAHQAGDASAKRWFDLCHGASVAINLSQLIAAGIVVGLLGV